MKPSTLNLVLCWWTLGVLALGSSSSECDNYSSNSCYQNCEVVGGETRCYCATGFNRTDNHTCAPISTSWNVIYATEYTIMNISSDGQVNYLTEVSQGRPRFVTCDVKNNLVYWTNGNGADAVVFKTKTTAEEKRQKPEVVVDFGIVTPMGIAFDWITGNLYFVDLKSQSIVVCAQNPAKCAVIVKGNNWPLLRWPMDIALHPNKGILFYTEYGDGSIRKTGMDGSSPTTIITEGLNIPTGITVDERNSRIYWAEMKLDKIESSEFDGSNRQLITRLTAPFGIDIIGDFIFASFDYNKIMSINKVPAENGSTSFSELISVPFGNTRIGLCVMHATKQQVLRRNPCKNLKCSHICALSGWTAVCLCPAGMMKDGETKCIDNEMQPKLLVAQNDKLIAIPTTTIGTLVVEPISLPSQITDISAIVYNPINDSLIISDAKSRKIVEYNLNTTEYRVLVDNVNVTAMDIDVISENLIWLDGGTKTIEVLSLRTLAQIVVWTGLENAQDMLFAPNNGDIYLSINGSTGKTYLVRIQLVPLPWFTTYNPSDEFSALFESPLDGPIHLTYNQETDGIAVILSVNMNGSSFVSVNTNSLKPATDNNWSVHVGNPVLDVVKIRDKIFWVDETDEITVAYTNSSGVSYQTKLKDILNATSKNSRKTVASMNRDIGHLEQLRSTRDCSTQNPNKLSCSHICLNRGIIAAGQYGKCACPSDFKLDSDGFTCIPSKQSSDYCSSRRDAKRQETPLVTIDPGDLDRLLRSPSQFPLKSNQRDLYNVTTPEYIFDIFNTFLLVPDLISEPGDMEKAILSLAHFNKQRCVKSKDLLPIEAWISIFPQGNVTYQILQALDIIMDANSRLDGCATVTHILLHYRWTAVNHQARLLINQDIYTARNIKHKSNITKLSFGVIFHPDNCLSSDPFESDLHLELVDIVLLLPYGPAKLHTDSFDALHCTVSFFQRTHLKYRVSKTLVNSLVKDLTIELDFDHHIYQYDPRTRNEINSKRRYLESVIHVESINKSTHQEGSMKKSVAAHEIWLRSPLSFDSKHIGASVYSNYTNINTTRLIPHILKNFDQILIQSRSNLSNDWANIENFVNNIGEYERKNVGRIATSLSTEQSESNKGIILGVNLYPDGTANISNTNKGIVGKALSVVKSITKLYPTAKATLLFTAEICPEAICHDTKYSVNLISNDFSPTSLNSTLPAKTIDGILMETTPVLQALQHIKNIKNTVALETGVLLDSDQCYLLLVLNREIVTKFEAVDIVVFKAFVKQSELKQKGALKIAVNLVKNFVLCKSAVQGGLVRAREWNKGISEKQVAFEVRVIGCNRKYSDKSEMTEFVRFWEIMNKWAKDISTTVFLNTVFEDPSLDTTTTLVRDTDCNEIYTDYAAECCDCGMWRTSENLNTNANLSFTFIEDKKSIALHLYEKQTGKGNKKTVEDSTKNLILSIAIPTISLCMFITFVAVYLAIRYRNKFLLTRKDIRAFHEGERTTTPNNISILAGSGRAQSQPYNKQLYELAGSNFKIDETIVLGTGEYAKVCQGFIKQNKVKKLVAVKMTRNRDPDSSYSHYLAVKGILSEIKVLSYLGQHKHIVTFEGAYTAHLRTGRVFVFLELCENGSLEKYLRHRCNPEQMSKISGNVAESSIGNNRLLSPKLSSDLLRWAAEIAAGMEYLTLKKLVHADLATRNILLTSSNTAKISDFGLSRRLYDYTEYVKEEQESLPWRWMAPESLRKLVFNEKTDVWSFGVTLWEMYTLGDIPYPGMGWVVNFPMLLDRGLRLPTPKYNEKDMFQVMQLCWKGDPDNRPSFAQLTSLIPSGDTSGKGDFYC